MRRKMRKERTQNDGKVTPKLSREYQLGRGRVASKLKSSALKFGAMLSSYVPFFPGSMAAPTESGHSRILDKEAISDFPSFRGDGCEQIQPANTEILKRATLKIDLYLIPILGMFCVSSHLLQLSLLGSHIPSVLLSFLVSASG